jgi:hypothetical protein
MMTTSRPGRILSRLALLMITYLWPLHTRASDTDWITTAQLKLEVGYEGNRSRTDSQTGSLFVVTSPQVGLTWFASQSSELSLWASFSHSEFTEAAYSSIDDYGLTLSALTLLESVSLRNSLSGGTYADGDWPTDDHSWLQFASTLWGYDQGGREYSCSANIKYLEFETVPEIEQDTYANWYGELRPGISLPAASGLVLWSDLLLQVLSSELETETYLSAGAAIGVTWSRPKFSLGSSLEWQTHRFEKPVTLVDIEDQSVTWTEDRDDDVLSASLWFSHRLSPWLTWYASCRFDETKSSIDLFSEEAWLIRSGIVLTAEHVAMP